MSNRIENTEQKKGLNKTQMMLLRMFDKPMSESESEELRDYINAFYKNRLDAQVDFDIQRKEISQKNYKDLEQKTYHKSRKL
jgi:lantibiotic modifying enzyme